MMMARKPMKSAIKSHTENMRPGMGIWCSSSNSGTVRDSKISLLSVAPRFSDRCILIKNQANNRYTPKCASLSKLTIFSVGICSFGIEVNVSITKDQIINKIL